MAYTPAIRPTTNRLLRAVRQQEATTGNRLTPDQIRAIVEGGLGAEASVSLDRARFAEEQRRTRMAEKAVDRQERAAAITGAAQLGALGYQMFKIVPEQLAIERAKTEAIRGIGTNIATGSTTSIGAGVTGGATETASLVNLPATTTSAPAGTTSGAGGMTALGAIGTAGIGYGVGNQMKNEEQGALAGAASGALAGSTIFPGVGTVAGAIIGGVGGWASGGEDESETVICQELHRQGYISYRVLKLDAEYSLRHVSRPQYAAYRMFADPIVRAMRKSKLVTWLVLPFGVAWARTMANKVNDTIKVGPVSKLLGNIILKVGLPICNFLSDTKYFGGTCHG